MRNQNPSHEVSCVRKVPVRSSSNRVRVAAEQLAVRPSVDIERVTGGGKYLLVAAFPMQVGLSAVQRPNGAAAGEFHQQGDLDGIRVDTDLQEPIHQPGQDVWFRLVDYGQGSGTPADRLTFLGFTGAAARLRAIA
jgi:hypothetical protein